MKLTPLDEAKTLPTNYDPTPNATVSDTTEVVVRGPEKDGEPGDIIDKFEVEEIEDEQGNYLFRFPLKDGTVVTLREPTGHDRVYLQQIAVKEKNGMPPLEMLYRMIARLCVGWGDKVKVSPDFFMGMSHRKLRPIEQRLEAMIAHFFRD